jgi:hypothetical protein
MWLTLKIINRSLLSHMEKLKVAQGKRRCGRVNNRTQCLSACSSTQFVQS